MAARQLMGHGPLAVFEFGRFGVHLINAVNLPGGRILYGVFRSGRQVPVRQRASMFNTVHTVFSVRNDVLREPAVFRCHSADCSSVVHIALVMVRSFAKIDTRVTAAGATNPLEPGVHLGHVLVDVVHDDVYVPHASFNTAAAANVAGAPIAPLADRAFVGAVAGAEIAIEFLPERRAGGATSRIRSGLRAITSPRADAATGEGAG